MTTAKTEPCLPDPAAEQHALVRALLNPARYPYPVAQVTLLETHISYVLLTGRFAYKIKKAVNFDFLDFSTLERRRLCCIEELRLNRRLAPELYLAVVPIIGTPQDPRFDSTDQPGDDIKPIEYAVKMNEFPQSALLDRRLAQGDLLATQIDDLARQVAEFHAQAARIPEGNSGTPPEIWALAAGNFSQLAADTGNSAEAAQLNRLEGWSRNEYARIETFLAQRRSEGFVRECHGDLHLGNIALIDGKPLAFDCIEFNPQLRWIDVMSEAAFLSMDLEERGRPDFARRFINRYLEVSSDYAGLQCLPFYQVYRALVRAKVAGLRAAQEEPQAARQQLEIRATYLAFAERAAKPRQRQLLLMHGVSGSGKTWISQTVLEHIGALRLRSDIERKRLHGLPELAHSASLPGCGRYDSEATRATYERLLQHAREVLQAGFPVLVDATFLRRWQRESFRRLAEELNLPFRIISCRADQAALRSRLVAREQSGSDASEAGLAILLHQLQNNDPLSRDEQDATIVFDSSQEPVSGLLTRVELKA
jgi:aminoglycoside phosphotransferase family enzyme/predicted kinase